MNGMKFFNYFKFHYYGIFYQQINSIARIKFYVLINDWQNDLSLNIKSMSNKLMH